MFREILDSIEQGMIACFEKDITRKNGEVVHIVRNFLPPQRLILLGGGHVAKPVVEFASKVEFDVVVVDDRLSFANAARFPGARHVICEAFPKAIEQLKINAFDYVAVITRGHKYDADCIRALLKGTYPFYLGLIGSKRRVMGLKDVLEQEGFDRMMLDKIHTPIGLDIGAATPEEIAVSIVAELIQCRRKGKGNSKRTGHLVQENTDMELLHYLAETTEPTAYAIVMDTKGSTPVKSGAIMAVNRMGRIWGTIGGGCSEHALMQDCLQVIDSGKSRVVTVDMTNDVAEMEGMVCGGTMEVYIERLAEHPIP